MLNIKRVLWIEDNETELDDRIKDIFIDKEKKTISNMEDAIKEFSSDHLYDYDTIVLDIDFRNDNSDIQTIINELNKRIFLEKEYNHDDLKHNGGYFLFLYLLERGYPSDRIAFLTGYDDIIHKLNIYNMMMRKVLSFDEIVEIFKEKWNEAEKEKKPNSFETSIYNLSYDYDIEEEYRNTQFIYECQDALSEDDEQKLRSLIENVFNNISKTNTGKKKEYKEYEEYKEDGVIFKFRDANLKLPMFFTKGGSAIPNHNFSDAKGWLNKKRTNDRVCRWLALNAGNYIESIWGSQSSNKPQDIQNVLFANNITANYDFGIRNAFKQMYYIFDGLKVIDYSRICYLALLSVLVPFESKPNNRGNNINQDIYLRRQFAKTANNARNYCAHNCLGTNIKVQSAMFLLMIVMTVILDSGERRNIEDWYKYVRDMIINNNTVPSQVSTTSINSLIDALWRNHKIDTRYCRVQNSLNVINYQAKDYLEVLGWHKDMKTKPTKREDYYIFTLAVHIVKVLEGTQNVSQTYGEAVEDLYKTAKVIVNSYDYQAPLN